MRKKFTIASIALLLATGACVAQQDDEVMLPHGFVTYSRGENYERVLCRAEIAPGMTFEQIHATERPVVEKGPYGGDITNQISFDGKWVAFARSLKGTSDGSGGNNYADFNCWDVYIARVDGKLPAQPIRISHGYFPSWGEDSRNSVKTLYFSKDEEPSVWKVKINDKGEIVQKETKVGDIPKEGYEGFSFAAPNGQFTAYRKSGAVYTYWFEGPNKGKHILMTGGCHPHVVANSQWVYHANRHPVRADGGARGIAGAGGLYHYGSSNDLNWFITRTEGDNTIINKGREAWLCTMYLTDERFDTEKAVKVSDMGGFLDIHVFDDKVSRKAAAHNRKIHEQELSGGVSETKAKEKGIKGLSSVLAASLPVNKKGELFVWTGDKDNNQIKNSKGAFLRSCRLVPNGFSHAGRAGRMVLDGGYFSGEDSDYAPLIVEALKKSNQMSIELNFITKNLDVTGPARMASMSKDWSLRNWTIGQEKDKLILRLRTTTNGENGTNKEIELVSNLKVNTPYHLLLSYAPGILLWSVNGEQHQTMDIQGDINNWSDYKLIFGDEFSGERVWKGEINNFHFYAYALTPKEIKVRYNQSKKLLETLTPEKTIQVKAKLIKTSTMPTVQQIKEQGYSRCVTTRHFCVTDPMGNNQLKEKDILLKEWTVLGLQEINQRKEGNEYVLNLYDAKKHEELGNEYTAEDLTLFDLPVYYNESLK